MSNSTTSIFSKKREIGRDYIKPVRIVSYLDVSRAGVGVEWRDDVRVVLPLVQWSLLHLGLDDYRPVSLHQGHPAGTGGDRLSHYHTPFAPDLSSNKVGAGL